METRTREENDHEEMTRRARSSSTAIPREQRLFRSLVSQESEKSSAPISKVKGGHIHWDTLQGVLSHF